MASPRADRSQTGSAWSRLRARGRVAPEPSPVGDVAGTARQAPQPAAVVTPSSDGRRGNGRRRRSHGGAVVRDAPYDLRRCGVAPAGADTPTVLHQGQPTPLRHLVSAVSPTSMATVLSNSGSSTSDCNDRAVESPLLDAARKGDAAACTRLLKMDVDVCAADRHGNRALELAAVNGHGAVVKVLTDAMATTQSTHYLHTYVLRSERQDGMLASHLAAQGNHADVLEHLVNICPRLLVEASGANVTAVHYASMSNSAAALRVLLNHAERQGMLSDVIMKTAERGMTSLHLSAAAGHDECFKILLENGADLSVTDGNGETALFALVASYQAELLEFALHVVCPEQGRHDTAEGDTRVVQNANAQGDTVLHSAISSGSVACAKLLCDKCPELLLIGERELPVCTCVRLRSLLLLRHILPATLSMLERFRAAGRRCPAEGDVIVDVINDRRRRTLLHCAAMTGSVAVLSALLEHCKANSRHRKLIGCGLPGDSRECTPVFYLAWMGYTKAARVMLAHCQGADSLFDVRAALLNTSRDGRSAYYIAARNGHWRLLQCLLATGTSASLPRPPWLGVHLNTGDEHDLSPLHVASMHCRLRCVRILLKHGAHFTRDRYGRSPLHYASLCGHEDVCRELARRCDRSCLDWVVGVQSPLAPSTGQPSDGRTALHLAAGACRQRVVQVLLDCGASVMRNGRGQTAFDTALTFQHRSIVDVFLKHQRWQEVVQLSNSRDSCKRLVATMPDLATLLLDRFTTVKEGASTGVNTGEITHNLRYLYYHFGSEAQAVGRENATLPLASDQDSLSADGLSDYIAQSNTSLNELGMAGGDADADADGADGLTMVTRGLHSTAQLVADLGVTLWQGQAADVGGVTDAIPQCFGKDCMIADILESDNHQLLCHPVIASWTRKKWFGYIMPLTFVNFFIYLLHLTFLTYLAVAVTPHQRCPQFYDYRNPQKYERRGRVVVASYVVIAFCCGGLLKEVSQMLQLGIKRYCLDVTNILEWTLYILALVFALPLDNPPSRWQWIVGSVALLLSWANLILFLERLPMFGIYVAMFLKICKSVAKALAVFVLFICAFGFSFHVLMSEADNFRTVGRSLMMMVNIATGMISIPENFYQIAYRQVLMNGSCSDPENAVFAEQDGGEAEVLSEFFTWLFLLVFLLCMPIILMNMLIGLAVGDIALVRRQAAQSIAVSQAHLILNLESKLPARFLRRFANFPQRVVRNSSADKSSFREVMSQLKSVTGDLGLPEDQASGEPRKPDIDETPDVDYRAVTHKMERILAGQQRLGEQLRQVLQLARQRDSAEQGGRSTRDVVL